jgi:hypothetical protein
VREDYSADGTAWDSFPHDHARSRAYRWGEDGLAGISDAYQHLCFGLALWNGQDPILKERLYGLTNDEGNNGEDVKEYYFYCDNTPTHSYMKWLYKYPQRAFPYLDLKNTNAQRKQNQSNAFEYELLDTGIFAESRYFDVQVEYAKAGPTDILVSIKVTNHGPDTAPLRLLPTLWFRNRWSWSVGASRPTLSKGPGAIPTIQTQPLAVDSADIPMYLYCQGADSLLFCENDTDMQGLWNAPATTPCPKNGINNHVVSGAATVNLAQTGTKASASYSLTVNSQQTVEVRLRLTSVANLADPCGAGFATTFASRLGDANEFYKNLGPGTLTPDQIAIQRQAYAGMLWNKQYYLYVVNDWLDGDAPAQPRPPASRNGASSRNTDWPHLYAANILSVPDTWEYPWFASWDLCFHSVVLARLDIEFAKQQLRTLAGAWFMSPEGAIPAYEWKFGDANPPLHAWAALRIHEIDIELNGGTGDLDFLNTIFDNSLMYFTWWSNRKNSDQNNLFEGGFLGLDNISIIDRSNLPPSVQEVYQSDGTSWMGMFCLNMMDIALLLSKSGQREYDELVNKFFQHFIFIADALNNAMKDNFGHSVANLWDRTDGFYYDVLRQTTGEFDVIRLRSLVGLIPLFSVAMLETTFLSGDGAYEVKERLDWFQKRHPEMYKQAVMTTRNSGNSILLSLVDTNKLRQILMRALDEKEFLSPFGIRGLSKVYANPYSLQVQGSLLSLQYEPAEAPSNGPFGGNSNWRGPVWFPINYLFIDSLRRLDLFLGTTFTIEYPLGSGKQSSLKDVATVLARRLVSLFESDSNGNRPVYGGTAVFQSDSNWKDLILFFEYFHGENGAGLGASHQTGWTGLVAELLRIL